MLRGLLVCCRMSTRIKRSERDPNLSPSPCGGDRSSWRRPSSWSGCASRWQPSCCVSICWEVSEEVVSALPQLGLPWCKPLTAYCIATHLSLTRLTVAWSVTAGVRATMALSMKPCIFAKASSRFCLQSSEAGKGFQGCPAANGLLASAPASTHACRRLFCEVTTRKPSFVIRFFSCESQQHR